MTLATAQLPLATDPQALGGKQARIGEYGLFARSVRESGARSKTIYFFSRVTPLSGVPAAIPSGYEVVHLATGPMLRRKRRA